MCLQSLDADAIIEKTSRIYEEWGGVDATFTIQISSPDNGSTESFEGVLKTKKNKFILTTPEMITWFDGATQWSYVPRNNEVHIDNPTGDDLRLLNPMLLLQDYKKDFDALLTGESTTARAKTAYDVTLAPKKKGEIEKIEIQIEKNASIPAKLVITMRNRFRNIILIETLKAVNHGDEIFTFPSNFYPDVEIIDLRR